MVLAHVSMRYSIGLGRFPRVTHPSATDILLCPFDLHVLSLPPAFVLSQDQTLKLRNFDLLTLSCRSKLTRVQTNHSHPKAKTVGEFSISKRRQGQSIFWSNIRAEAPQSTANTRRPRLSFFLTNNVK